MKRFITSITGLAAAGSLTAIAGINYVDAYRDVYAFADVGEQSDSNEDFSTSLGGWSSSVSAYSQREIGVDAFDTASAYAWQDSSLGEFSIDYSAYVTGSATSVEYGSSWTASSYLSVSFTVDEPIDFLLSATLGETIVTTRTGLSRARAINSPLLIELTDGDSNLLGSLDGPGSFSGTFVPGVTYNLFGSLGFESFGPFTDGQSASFLLETQTAVPEAGTSAAVAGLAGLALWQWRRRRA